jgi:glycerol-3-phosphate dehydrogenase
MVPASNSSSFSTTGAAIGNGNDNDDTLLGADPSTSLPLGAGSSSSSNNNDDNVFDVVVLGGGVVGLAILRTLSMSMSLQSQCQCQRRLKVVCVEQQPHLLSAASGSNSGIVCTGVDAPLGSLERALIRDSISTIRPYLRDMNIPHRDCGSLVTLWPWDDITDDSTYEDDIDSTTTTTEGQGIQAQRDNQNKKLRQVASESWEAGDTHAKILTAEEIHRMEPALALSSSSSSKVFGGVHIPGEIVVDPWLYSVSLAVQARHLGATIYTDWECDAEQSEWNDEERQWTLHRHCRRRRRRRGDTNCEVFSSSSTPDIIKARVVINACGIYSDKMQQATTTAMAMAKTISTDVNGETRPQSHTTKKNLLPAPPYEARPRRGQYVIYSQCGQGRGQRDSDKLKLKKDKLLLVRPIQPIPTQFSKGVFVFSTLYDQVVVGPTALDQTSREDNSLDPKVRLQLEQHGRRILPEIFTSSNSKSNSSSSNYIGEYVGIRPGTSQRDYQIHSYPLTNWITVGGIRSTGLTASLGIGRYVARMVAPLLLITSSVSSSTSSSSSVSLLQNDNYDDSNTTSTSTSTSMCALPPLEEMVKEFHSSGDKESVTIHGHPYKVTHPITRFGWKSQTGFASACPDK